MISEIMDDESGDDRISNLPDSVICHILSRLPTKYAVQTSILSKDWKYKWTSIYNIQIDRMRKSKTFHIFVDRILRLTQSSRIKSFYLTCWEWLAFHHLKTWTRAVLMRGDIENLEIIAMDCARFRFVDDLYRCGSLTELKLGLNCVLTTSPMKNCFPNLKILSFDSVDLLNDDKSDTTGRVVMNFPVLEELELHWYRWLGVESVEINAPALRFLTLGQHKSIWLNDDDGLENFVVTAPLVLRADLKYCVSASIRLQAHKLLKGFPALEYLKLSSQIVKALIEKFPLPCFNRLKQLELYYRRNDGDEALVKLIQVMPSLESITLSVFFWGEHNYTGLLLSSIASRLKVVTLSMFGGESGQIHLAKSVLKVAENLETLFVSVRDRPVMPKTEIKRLLSTSPKISTRASIFVYSSE